MGQCQQQWDGTRRRGRGVRRGGGEKESESCIAVELNVGALKCYMLIAVNKYQCRHDAGM